MTENDFINIIYDFQKWLEQESDKLGVPEDDIQEVIYNALKN